MLKSLTISTILGLSLSACVSNYPPEQRATQTTTTTTDQVIVDNNSYRESDQVLIQSPGRVVEREAYTTDGQRVIVQQRVNSVEPYVVSRTEQVVVHDVEYPVMVRDQYPPYRTKYVYNSDRY